MLKKKIVIGTANFNQKYGLLSQNVKEHEKSCGGQIHTTKMEKKPYAKGLNFCKNQFNIKNTKKNTFNSQKIVLFLKPIHTGEYRQ